ncbi:hypothetical protein N7490_003300 [Penicillium lividum]|nr:hypothetical protein N7490_003300 [Penicillium lividum]
MWKDSTLPIKVNEILDITTANGGNLSHGLYFLCKQSDEVLLMVKFVRPGREQGDTPRWAQYDLIAPEGASSIESFVDFTDPTHRSGRFVGSPQGLHSISSNETTKRGSSILLTEESSFRGAKDLFVAQGGPHLSVWARNNQDELGFLVTSCDHIYNSRVATLLPAGRATSFSAAVCKPAENLSTVKQILTVNDESGNLTLLEQSLDTGIWRTEPFYVEEGGNLMAIPSYTINMTALDDKKRPFCNGQVFIKSSSLLSATLNGRSDTLDPKGRWYSLDSAGDLALIIPTNGLTSQPLQISKV